MGDILAFASGPNLCIWRLPSHTVIVPAHRGTPHFNEARALRLTLAATPTFLEIKMSFPISPVCIAAYEEGLGQFKLNDDGILRFHFGAISHELPLSIVCLVLAAATIVTHDDSIPEWDLRQACQMPNEYGVIAFQVNRYEAVQAPVDSPVRKAILDKAIEIALTRCDEDSLADVLDDLEDDVGVKAIGTAITQEEIQNAEIVLRKSFDSMLESFLTDARDRACNAKDSDDQSSFDSEFDG